MREAILAAVHSGDIEELRQVYEPNDLQAGPRCPLPQRPCRTLETGLGRRQGPGGPRGALPDPGGRLRRPAARRDLENNRVYIWPYFAEVPLDKLTPAQEVELLRLVPPAVAKE